MVTERITTIDLFCGAGGITEGFRQAGFDCRFANDFNHHAIETFSANHSEASAVAAPIETLDPRAIRRAAGLRRGDLGVLVGGPPCQGFSINAPERFLDDPRNSLFKHYIRFLDEFEPAALLMENVPGMLSFAGGKIFERIIGEIRRRGYIVNAKILLAAHYGVPQERWRLIILGSRSQEPIHPVPSHFANGRPNFTGGRTMTLGVLPIQRPSLRAPVTVSEAIGDLPRLAMGEGAEELDYDSLPRSEYAGSLRNPQGKVFNHFAPKLSPQNVERMRHVPPGGSWRDIPFELLPKGMKLARRSDHTKRYGRLHPDRLSPTIMTKCDPHWGSVFLPDQDRSLTVREAARFQSFPDSYRFIGPRVAQYEQVGNAVPVLMARAIASAIRPAILGSKSLAEAG